MKRRMIALTLVLLAGVGCVMYAAFLGKVVNAPRRAASIQEIQLYPGGAFQEERKLAAEEFPCLAFAMTFHGLNVRSQGCHELVPCSGCLRFAERIFKNPEITKYLNEAEGQDIDIFVGNQFAVSYLHSYRRGYGEFELNHNASDAEVLAFFLGNS